MAFEAKALECPRCGAGGGWDDRFEVSDYVRHTHGVLDGRGGLVEEMRTFSGGVAEGASLTCRACGFEGPAGSFAAPRADVAADASRRAAAAARAQVLERHDSAAASAASFGLLDDPDVRAALDALHGLHGVMLDDDAADDALALAGEVGRRARALFESGALGAAHVAGLLESSSGASLEQVVEERYAGAR